MQQTGRNAHLVALVFGIAILFSLGMFFYELKAVRSATEATFRYRAKVIDYYINARIQDVDAMARAFVQHYAYAPERGFGRLRREPKFGGWALSGFESEGGVAGLAGAAVGFPLLPAAATPGLEGLLSGLVVSFMSSSRPKAAKGGKAVRMQGSS